MMTIITIEHWKLIENFENYEVSDTGFVRNRNSRKILYQNIKKNGYFYVQLWKNNKSKNKNIHRLVAITFIENPNNLPLVDHLDGNKQNNRFSNLRWCTQSQNIANTKMYSTNTTGIRGVYFNKKNQNFRAQIGLNNKNYDLGSYDSEFEAGFVQEFFSLLLFKEFASLYFFIDCMGVKPRLTANFVQKFAKKYLRLVRDVTFQGESICG